MMFGGRLSLMVRMACDFNNFCPLLDFINVPLTQCRVSASETPFIPVYI